MSRELCSICDYPIGDPRCTHWGESLEAHPTEPQGETPLADKVTKLLAATPFERDARYALAVGFLAGVERALSECRRELETGRDAQIQAKTLAQLLDAAIRRLNELGDKSWKLPPYASRLASHAEREGAVATVTDEDGTVRPVCTGEPSPAPDSQAEELVEITRYRCATVRTAMKPETAHGEMIPMEIGEWVRYIDVGTLLRSRQAPRGNSYRRVKIEALRALGPNWNSYDCEAFSKESVDAALALEPHIPAEFNSIVPIAGGGVQFGKNGDEVTIEVYAAHPQSGEDDTQIRKLMEGE